jgi:RNA polymerase sigma-70 factor (ECF subfamily)
MKGMASRDTPVLADLVPLRPGGGVKLPSPESDEVLVAALRARDPDAGALLFDRYATHVRRVLVRVLGPDPELLDLVHDVFVTALESVNRLSEPKALRGWLTQVAVFTARGKIRRRVRWRFLRTVSPQEMPELEHHPTDFEASQALRSAYRVLGQLSPDDRIAFALRFIDGMELTEVAEACDVSLATIKRRLARARQRFSELSLGEPALAEWLGGAS